MRLTVKNKLFSVTGKSWATDESGQTVYTIKGSIGFTRRKRIYDKNKVLVYKLRNKFFRLTKDKVFIYNASGEKIATLISKRFDFKNKFTLEGHSDEMTFSGNLFQFPNIKLEITKNDQVIGVLTKQFTIVRDTFTIDVNSEVDAALLVALTIAIDNIYDRKRK